MAGGGRDKISTRSSSTQGVPGQPGLQELLHPKGRKKEEEQEEGERRERGGGGGVGRRVDDDGDDDDYDD